MKKKQGSAQPKCPQCNAPIKAATIRRIYLPGGKSSLRIMDTTERDELMGKIREEQRLRFQMEQQQQQLALRYKEEIEHWKRELEQRTAELSRLKQLGTPRGFSSTVSMPVQFLHSPSRSMGSVSGAAASQRLLFQFQDGVEISRDPGASRAMSFCRQSGVIAVSKSADWHSASGQFNCHGLLCTRIERTGLHN
jgi:hypothetical protein